MGSVKAARQAALAAYIAAGAALSAADYTLASAQANLNAIASAQQRLSDAGWHDHLAGDHEASTWRSVGEGLALDKRPCPRLAGGCRARHAFRGHGGRLRPGEGRRQQ